MLDVLSLEFAAKTAGSVMGLSLGNGTEAGK